MRREIKDRMYGWLAISLVAQLLCAAQTGANATEAVEVIPRSAVTLDGETLFQVRGYSTYPAEQRAETITGRIRALASNPDYRTGSLQLREQDGLTRIEGLGQVVLAVTDADASLDGVDRVILAKALVARIDDAISAYRRARTPEALWMGALQAVVTTALFAAGLFLFLWVYRRVEGATERYCKVRMQKAQIQALTVVEGERLWTTLHNALRVVRMAVLVTAAFFYLNIVLALFPWTKPFSARLFDLVLGPLRTMGLGVVHSLPNLAFLVVLFFVVRLLLKLTRMFFEAIERGNVVFGGFDPDWSGPTFRIVRTLIVAFGLVVAYPYLPGSGSDAFKGVSLFIGVVFSLGSTGLISNLLAGYSLTYRRAYRVGDRVRIGDVAGDVEYVRLQVTHLRSVKNEEIIIPNSVILNSSVINYSSLARKEGLILHTTVGIGYETPWRQVEAMLLLAAERTPELLREPPPFVLHQNLSDFCVNYELNVYTDQPQKQLALYTALHRNILDVFNEYGVQIMTPAYEGDPGEPKVVPKDKWFEAPAKELASLKS